MPTNLSAFLNSSFTGAQGAQGATGAQGAQGAVGSPSPRAISIINPQTNDTIPFFYTTVGITISAVTYAVYGTSTPSTSFNIVYGTTLGTPGTNITASVMTASTGTATTTSSFSSATVNANQFVWLNITASSGIVSALNVTVNF